MEQYLAVPATLVVPTPRLDLPARPTSETDRQLSSSHTTATPSTAYLDGLRGLAAILVLIQHYVANFNGSVHEHGFGESGHYYLASLPVLRLFFSGGNAAVAVFFVLSGFVLSRALVRRLRDGEDQSCGTYLISAVVRRPIRLYVPSLIIIFTFAVVIHLPYALMEKLPWAQPTDTVMEELNNALRASMEMFSPFRLFDPFRRDDNTIYFAYNFAIWTIPIELKGSMLVYSLLAIYAYSDPRPARMLGVLATATFVLLQTGYWAMACFVAGLCLTLVDVHTLDIRLFRRSLSSRGLAIFFHTILLVALYLLGQPAHPPNMEYSADTWGWHSLTKSIPPVYDQDNYYRYWLAWGGILLIYAIIRIPWCQRSLNANGLRYLGKVSFMLYLLHFPMWHLVGDRVAKMFGRVLPGAQASWWNNRLFVPDVGPTAMSSRIVLTLAIMVPVNIWVASFATKMLDDPCVMLGKWLAARLGLEVTDHRWAHRAIDLGAMENSYRAV